MSDAQQRNPLSADQQSYRVSKLRDGTVIDHIEPGRALEALRVLQLPPDALVSIGINFPSGKHGRKDLIKVDGLYLSSKEISLLSFISPAATVSLICNFVVTEKRRADLPAEVRGFLQCPNGECITNHEREAVTRFSVSNETMTLLCQYCERTFGRDQLRLR